MSLNDFFRRLFLPEVKPKFKTRVSQLLHKVLPPKEAKPKSKKLMLVLTVFFICSFVFILIAGPIMAYQILYQDQIYQGVYIDGLNVGGSTQTEAINKLNNQIDNLKQNGLNFDYQNNKFKVEFDTISPTDPDLSYQILNFDVNKMVSQAYAVGRQGGFADRFGAQLNAILHQPKIPMQYTLKDEDLKEILKQNYSKFEKPGQDAQIIFNPDDSFKIGQEVAGSVLNYNKAIADLKAKLSLMTIPVLELQMVSTIPLVSRLEAEKNINLVSDILKQESLILIYQDKKWEIAKAEFKNWLIFKKDNNQIKLGLKDDSLNQKLQTIGSEINVLPQDAKFIFSEGKVTEFVPNLPGLELDLEKNKIKIEQDFLANKINQVELVVKESEPKIKISDINNFGIKELIGKGVSDFSGSHTNRIKNIKNAAAHLNGIIIPPGEFSTTDAIGPVDASTGYFQEYVIKGDRTIPEYGGGLCQIGTTMFRAALYSGLPITERRPHSYIVTYYKPLGMDATIYGPHPDLRFLNDTGNNILLQIKIDGTELTFEFWGTSDGRKVEITDPELYNWTAQPADRLIENPKLKPGDKKLMEKGRRGADAHFYRYLTMPGQEKKEEIFRSHYVSWPNIYEVGITPKPEVPPTDTTVDPSTASSAAAGESGSSTNQNTNSQ